MVATNTIIQQLLNKIIDLVTVEINKDDMKEIIRTKVVHPLLELIFKQLYPYILTLVLVVSLMFVMLIVMLVTLLMYLRK